MTEPQTLAALLQHNARNRQTHRAVIDREVEFDWPEFVDRVARAATVLADGGLQHGQRFAILAPNSWRQAEITFAGYWSGVVPVPVNYRLAPREIVDILVDADVRLLVIDSQFASLLDGDALSHWREKLIWLGSDPKGGCHYDGLMREAGPLETADLHSDDEALLLYTSGTAGRCKGVPLSHGNIISNARQTGSVWHVTPDDVVLHVPPMFHSAELVTTVYLLQGAANAYLPRFEPGLLLEAIEQYRASFVLLVPTILMLTLQSGLTANHDSSSLRQLIYGASPMAAEWIRRAFAAFPGVEIAQGYGLTETAPLLTMLDHQSHTAALDHNDTRLLSSCGRALEGVELRVLNEQGDEVAEGEAGEIFVRGSNVFNGYLNHPQLNREIMVDGWFATGDIACRDAEGYIYLRDRKNDLIISGGEKVYSSEVEIVLHRHPAVAEAAVIGVPDTRFGEQVMAVIVRQDNANVDCAQLVDFCRDSIGGYKLPRRIEFVDRLPKSAMGKVLKTVLRRQYG